MAYTEENFKSKKALKEAFKEGRKIRCYQPGPFPLECPGKIYLEGPHFPAPHTWYGAAMVDSNGYIEKILS